MNVLLGAVILLVLLYVFFYILGNAIRDSLYAVYMAYLFIIGVFIIYTLDFLFL